jgi:hypothetical protein
VQISTNIREWERGRQLALASAAVTVVAAFMPWVTVFVLSVTGFDAGDGKLTALCGLFGAGLALGWWSRPRAHAVFQLVLGALVLSIGLYDLNDYAASGLYLTILAGGAWVVGSLMLVRRPQAPASPTSVA